MSRWNDWDDDNRADGYDLLSTGLAMVVMGVMLINVFRMLLDVLLMCFWERGDGKEGVEVWWQLAPFVAASGLAWTWYSAGVSIELHRIGSRCCYKLSLDMLTCISLYVQIMDMPTLKKRRVHVPDWRSACCRVFVALGWHVNEKPPTECLSPCFGQQHTAPLTCQLRGLRRRRSST